MDKENISRRKTDKESLFNRNNIIDDLLSRDLKHLKKSGIPGRYINPTDADIIAFPQTFDLSALPQFTQGQLNRAETELAEARRGRIADLERRLASAREQLGASEARTESVQARAGKAEQRAEDLSFKLRQEETTRINAESRARFAEEEARRAKAAASSESGSLSSWDPKGYYRLLGITDPDEARRATPEQLQRLFRAKSHIHHPDTGGNTRQMQRLSAAYDFLSNPLNRRNYGR